ncbi:MAG: 4'-phosphopantetheinyl transferase superfamily protein [bacterium]|nr:4'-phosphopantetheinyl transferase superfamily protein [bacterium]
MPSRIDPGQPLVGGDPAWWSAHLGSVPADAAWVDDREAERFAAMAFTKRYDEARLARYTAKSAVARFLGRPVDPEALREITVRNAPDGAPEVMVDDYDSGIMIAMTDRADWSVAAVAHGPDRIGCDLELVEARSDAFVGDYFTAKEQKLTRESPEPDLTSNLIWSAKESALKVLRTGLRRDTRTVEVSLGSQSPGWSQLTITLDEGGELGGWWIRYGRFILTVAGAAQLRSPRSLEDPPPISMGQPDHRWLESPRRQQ